MSGYYAGMLSEEDVREFQAIYRAQYGKEISTEDASFEARKLVSFVESVYGCLQKPAVQALLRCVLEEERVRKEKHVPENERAVDCA